MHFTTVSASGKDTVLLLHPHPPSLSISSKFYGSLFGGDVDFILAHYLGQPFHNLIAGVSRVIISIGGDDGYLGVDYCQEFGGGGGI